MGSQADKKQEELGLKPKATGNYRAAQTGKPFFYWLSRNMEIKVKPNRPDAKCNREILTRTSKRVFHHSYQPVRFAFPQISSLGQGTVRFFSAAWAKSYQLMPIQMKNISKYNQEENAVR